MKLNDIIIIGDRVLIKPDSGKERTASGLYLPQGVREKEKIQSGHIVAIGPGYAIPTQPDTSAEPWLNAKNTNEPKYVPLQVAEGDYAIFFKRESIEIEYDSTQYLIIPQAGILAVVRNRSTRTPL